MTQGGFVYILTNKWKTVYYIGVTNNIKRRIYEHKTHFNRGFASKYNCELLVYFETFWSIEDAIAREKQIKKWNRQWKENLIIKENPNYDDLSEGWNFDEFVIN